MLENLVLFQNYFSRTFFFLITLIKGQSSINNVIALMLVL